MINRSGGERIWYRELITGTLVLTMMLPLWGAHIGNLSDYPITVIMPPKQHPLVVERVKKNRKQRRKER